MSSPRNSTFKNGAGDTEWWPGMEFRRGGWLQHLVRRSTAPKIYRVCVNSCGARPFLCLERRWQVACGWVQLTLVLLVNCFGPVREPRTGPEGAKTASTGMRKKD